MFKAKARTGRVIHFVSEDQDLNPPGAWALCAARVHVLHSGPRKPRQQWCDECLMIQEKAGADG